jgi:hypothetical protein
MHQVPSYLTGVAMLLVAIGTTLFWDRLASRRWQITAFGALAWIVTVALKFAWKTPTNDFIQNSLGTILGSTIGDTTYWIYRGVLTGVFECLVLYFIIVRTRLRDANWIDAVAFGVGFGAIEALGLGVFSIVRTSMPGAGAPVQLTYPLYIFVIRFTVTIVHVFTSVAVLYAASMQERHLIWLSLSFLFKSAFDGVGALIIFGGFLRQLPQESSLLAWSVLSACVGLVGLWYLHRDYGFRAAKNEYVLTAAAS